MIHWCDFSGREVRMYDTELWRRAACPADEKKKLIPVITLLVGLAEKAVREGLLAIEDDLPGIEPLFVRKGLGLVTDGTDPELVREVLDIWMRTGDFSGIDLLTRMAAADGILCIQRGETPRVMRALLYAYLGEEGVHEDTSPAGPGETGYPRVEPVQPPRAAETAPARVAETADDARCRQELADIMAVNGRVLSEEPVSEDEILALAAAGRLSADGARILAGMLESMPLSLQYRMLAGFEAYDAELHSEILRNRIVFDDLAGCGDRDIQKILREVDTQDLAKALKGTGPELREKIFRNMSSRAVSLLREDMEHMGPVRVEDVEDAQGRMVRVARLLREAGEILIARPGDRFL